MLPDRIELSTSPLPRECSTTELRQHIARKIQNRPLVGYMAGGRFLPQEPPMRKHAGARWADQKRAKTTSFTAEPLARRPKAVKAVPALRSAIASCNQRAILLVTS